MNPDLQRFSAAFFAESHEGLDVMEAGLLALDQALDEGTPSTENIHAIFRAAHSLKGGAATFGFEHIAALTHLLETLLEELRSAQRPLERPIVDSLLAATDKLRQLLLAAEHDQVVDADSVHAINARLQAHLGQSVSLIAATQEPATASATSVWQIQFIPQPTLFMNGNDPLHVLRELQSLGTLQVRAQLPPLPDFEQLDPLQAWLQWDIHLHAAVPQQRIEAAFAWVEEVCQFQITPQLVAEEKEEEKETAVSAASAALTPMAGASDGSHSIRVSVHKVDTLINLVGELVITQSMLQQATDALGNSHSERLAMALERLERNTRDLRDAVISTRMLPVKTVFQRFPRLLRDLAARLGKQVRLHTFGENTELDRGMIEKITDPLAHLLRNAIDHGIESPEQRHALGKPETGTISLTAAQQNGHIVIEINDDGRGLNREVLLQKAAARGLDIPDNPSDAQVWNLIFAPGFSTAEAVTDVSGRGVGMDVVRRNIQGLGGQVQLQSHHGQGTQVSIHLPLTLAMVEGMVVSVSGHTLIVPLPHIVEVMQPGNARLVTMAGQGRTVQMRGQHLPVVSLHQYYCYPGQPRSDGLLVAVRAGERQVALEVDELLGQQQVVVKNIQAHYRPVKGISAATVLGDGRVALIADIGELVRSY